MSEVRCLTEPELEALVNAAMGRTPFTMLLRNPTLTNVVTAETHPADIGILGGRVAYVGPVGKASLRGRKELDLEGRYVAPRLTDAHLHVESSMLTPPRFAESVVPHGTTTAAIDPHEIANVLGKDGVRMMLESSEGLPMRVHLLVPTCVPSLPEVETAGGELEASNAEEMLAWPRALSLGEVMDYHGLTHLVSRTTGIVKVGLSRGTVVDGHAPGLSGRELTAYVAGGVEADHEVVSFEEVLERLRLGMLVKLRKGALTVDLVRRLTTLRDKRNLLLVTDDVMPQV